MRAVNNGVIGALSSDGGVVDAAVEAVASGGEGGAERHGVEGGASSHAISESGVLLVRSARSADILH